MSVRIVVFFVALALALPDVSLAQTKTRKRRAKPQTIEAPASSEGTETNDESASDKSASDKPSDNSVASVINSLDYPELQVVPRASERLKMEAKDEDSTWYVFHWPMELSGFATAANAAMAKSQYRDGLSSSDKSAADTVVSISQVVGIGWMAAGVLVGLQRPYRSGMDQISKINGKDERSLLMRERLAEESLEKPARLLRPLKWASVITNFSLSALTGIFLSDQGRIISGVSATLAFLPLMYEDRSIDIYEKHIDYKKKIYRPMSGLDLHFDDQKRPVAAVKLLWDF